MPERFTFFLMTIFGLVGVVLVAMASQDITSLPWFQQAYLTVAGFLSAGAMLLGFVLLSMDMPILPDDEAEADAGPTWNPNRAQD